MGEKVKRMKRLYLAGKYGADTESGVYDNIHGTRMVARHLRRMGYAVFVPHMNTAFEGGVVTEEHHLEEYLAWLRAADLLVVMPDSEKSEGTQGEIAFANERNIPVYYWPADRNTLMCISGKPTVMPEERERPSMERVAGLWVPAHDSPPTEADRRLWVDRDNTFNDD